MATSTNQDFEAKHKRDSKGRFREQPSKQAAPAVLPKVDLTSPVSVGASQKLWSNTDTAVVDELMEKSEDTGIAMRRASRGLYDYHNNLSSQYGNTLLVLDDIWRLVDQWNDYVNAHNETLEDRETPLPSCSVCRGCLRVVRVCHRWWCGVGGGCGGVFMFGVDVCGRVVVLSL